MIDFNPVPLPLSLQAELAARRSRRLQPIRERPVRKDDEVGHDPETAGQGDRPSHEKVDGEALR